MDKRKFVVIFSLLSLLISSYLLVTGAPILSKSLLQTYSIPIGNIITWIGLLALPILLKNSATNLYLPKSSLDRYVSGFLFVIIVCGFLWLPISYLLAGNMEFNFGEKEGFQGSELAYKFFWYGTITIVIVPLVLFFIYTILTLLKRNR